MGSCRMWRESIAASAGRSSRTVIISDLRPFPLDVIGLQRRKAVERHRGVGGGIGAGALDQQLVADLEADWQSVGFSFVHDVGRIAGRSRDHAWGELVAVTRRADRIADRLVHGLGEAAEF